MQEKSDQDIENHTGTGTPFFKSGQMQKKINIMFMIDFLHGFSGGGTETHLSYLVGLLNRDRFRCVIVAFDTVESPFVKKIKDNGVDVIHIPVGRYYTLNALIKALVLKRLIKRMQIDIVQTFHFKSDTYGVMVAKLSGVKHILSSKRDVGDTKSKWHWFLSSKVQRIIDAYIVVADKVGKVIAEKENVPVSKINTIYNGVDILKFNPPKDAEIIVERGKIGLNEDDFVMGMVAVFRPEKNHDIFFRSVENVMKIIDNMKVLVVGGGLLLNHYKEICKKTGIYDRIIFTGATDNVVQYLQALDVACLVPGSNEGFSNSIIEKMAMRLPLIVTDVGGNAEAVLDGYNGIVIPPNDTDALTDAIVELYNDKDKRKEMGIRSRERVEKLFTLEKMTKNYEAYYDALMK